MSNPQIEVHQLSKTYRIPQRDAGLKAALKSLIQRRYSDVEAVRDVSFSVEAGEMIGFIGPNGAGKTTTLKMLSGLLYPSRGQAQVNGFVPWERKPEFLRSISMVMGNKGQLAWENTIKDSFLVLGEIYRVPRPVFQHNLDELVALLEIEDLLPKMARNLSLGERMKCELAAALLHQPRTVFLDEPTLGLDVTMQFRLRRFIADYNRQRGATIVLTSHYMADVVSLCARVLLIHQGQQLFDGLLSHLSDQMAPFRLVRVAVGNGNTNSVEEISATMGDAVTLLEKEDSRYTLRVKKAQTALLTTRLLNEISVADIMVEDPPVEAVIDQVYREGVMP